MGFIDRSKIDKFLTDDSDLDKLVFEVASYLVSNDALSPDELDLDLLRNMISSDARDGGMLPQRELGASPELDR